MLHVAQLMREHAGDLVGLLRFLQQPVEQIDLAARQREGVRDEVDEHMRLERHVDAAGRLELVHHLRERRLPVGAVADLPPNRTCDLLVDRVADALLER